MKFKKFSIDQRSIENLKQKLEDNHLNSCIGTLDGLVNYSKKKYQVLSEQLLDRLYPMKKKKM